MSVTFTVPCKNCGNPIAITVESNHSGGVGGVCHHCSHMVNVSYSCNADGKLIIHNVM